jgi:hypothetical protein
MVTPASTGAPAAPWSSAVLATRTGVSRARTSEHILQRGDDSQEWPKEVMRSRGWAVFRKLHSFCLRISETQYIETNSTWASYCGNGNVGT